MKNISAEFQAALSSAPNSGLVPRRLVTFHPKDRSTGEVVEIGIWNDIEDMNITVYSGLTGTAETRPFYGDVGLSVGEVIRVSDLTMQTVAIEISQIADLSSEIARTYDARLAKCEIHDLLLDPVSRVQVAPAEIAFLGLVDDLTIDTPESGGDGKMTFSVISDAIAMLERINPMKSSYEGQKRRFGDEWGRYSSTIANWTVPWGTE